MTKSNDEARMTNRNEPAALARDSAIHARKLAHRARNSARPFVIRASSFLRHSSFDIRHFLPSRPGRRHFRYIPPRHGRIQNPHHDEHAAGHRRRGGAFAFYHVPLPTCALAAGLCGVSGMLPDLDSGPGRPLRESTAFAAAVVPMMLLDRMEQFGLAPRDDRAARRRDLSADSLRPRLAAAAFHGPSRDVSQLAGGDRSRPS